ncbi:hypothetical protein VIGAN_11174900, partial [Vigna angularis var. angularis]
KGFVRKPITKKVPNFQPPNCPAKECSRHRNLLFLISYLTNTPISTILAITIFSSSLFQIRLNSIANFSTHFLTK